ncbi:MAG: site-specific DNA-methyltransferase [Nitrospira sp.]
MSNPQISLNSAIYRGNAFELLKSVPTESVRLVLTDPPYEVSQKNNLHTMGRRGIDFGVWDHAFDQTGWLEDAVRSLVRGGSIIIWNDWKLLGLIAAHLETLGMVVKRQLVWRKNNPMPRNLLRVPVQASEFALWAVKPKGRWVFNKRPSMPYERGEFDYPVVRGSAHPTKKPDGLFRDLIEMFSNPGDVVLDPFAGAGTTAVAAQRTGRTHISFELEQDYFELAVAALNKVVHTVRS